MERLEFRVHGMDGADEVAILRRDLGTALGGADRSATARRATS